MTGPLSDIRVIEMAGLGPGPFCCMMLADHGAEVIRVERPGMLPDPKDPLMRSRKIVTLDIKAAEGLSKLRELVSTADILVEGYRPGVMERLGAGPDVLLADNPKLIYGRMTGWGQTGPLAHAAGHDINYIALSGALHGFGPAQEAPVPPINLVGDFGGGAMMLAFGLVSALLAVRAGGNGQVIDCAMTDGSALLNAMTYGMLASGQWRDERGVNMLDGGAHFYNSYKCADGEYVAIGSIEPQFYAELRRRLDIELDPSFDDQMNPANWGKLREKLSALFLTQSRDYWRNQLEGSDACFAPVLSLRDAARHPHNAERGTFIHVGDTLQPAPAPRYSVTGCTTPRLPETLA